MEMKQHALEVAEARRQATDAALAQVRVRLGAGAPGSRKEEADARFTRITRVLGILATVGTLGGGAIGCS